MIGHIEEVAIVDKEDDTWKEGNQQLCFVDNCTKEDCDNLQTLLHAKNQVRIGLKDQELGEVDIKLK